MLAPLRCSPLAPPDLAQGLEARRECGWRVRIDAPSPKLDNNQKERCYLEIEREALSLACDFPGPPSM